MYWIVFCFECNVLAQHKKASNHRANLPLEMYSFTLQPPVKHLETTGADDPTF